MKEIPVRRFGVIHCYAMVDDEDFERRATVVRPPTDGAGES